MSADTAPAEMPGEDALIYEIVSHSSKPYGEKSARNAARAILALFAPILAEKERATEAKYDAASQAIDAIERADAAEARALAAEAALAAERERCSNPAMIGAALGKAVIVHEIKGITIAEQIVLGNAVIAAIRAQGE